jgi:cullin 3
MIRLAPFNSEFEEFIYYTEQHLDCIFSFEFETLDYNMVFHYILQLGRSSEDALASILNEKVKRYLEESYSQLIRFDSIQLLENLQASWHKSNAIIYVLEPLLNLSLYSVPFRYSIRNSFYSAFNTAIVTKSPIKARIKSGLNQCIDMERNGEEKLRMLIKTIVDIIIKSANNNTTLYQELFENYYIQVTSEYLQANIAILKEVRDLNSYNRNLDAIMNAEAGRIRAYLHNSTEPKIKRLIEGGFVEQRKLVIQTEQENLYALIENRQIDELRRKYSILSPEANLVPLIERYLKEAYLDQLNYLLSTCEKKQSFSSLIDQSSDLTNSFQQMISSALNNVPVFTNCINTAYKQTIESQPHYLYALGEKLKSLLTKDLILLNDNQIQAQLMHLYEQYKSYIENPQHKGYFMDIIVRILLNSEYVSEPDKNAIIKILDPAKFDLYQCVSNLVDNFKISRNFNALRPIVMLSVSILEENMVPKLVKCIRLPDVLSQTVGYYRNFLMNRPDKNKIILKTEYGSADMLFRNGNKRYEMTVSTYQMCILLLFNDKDSYTYQEISTFLGVSNKLFELHLRGLVTSNILTKDTPNESITPNSVISFNLQFKSNQSVLEVPVSYENVPDSKYSLDSISRREYILQATMLKILKSKKTLEHSALTASLEATLRNKFAPTSREIKSALDTLITKEYIERDKNESRLYNYIP